MKARKPSLTGQRLLLITAHPDDETFAAGMLWANHLAGGQAALICSTLGEKGMAHLRQPVTAAMLKKRRHRELLAAARLAGISSVHVLGLPDGGVSRKTTVFVRRAWSIVQRWRPDAIVSFGPDGMTGHRDHMAAGRVARQLARRQRCALYVFTLPRALARRAPAWFIKGRVNPHYQSIRPYAEPTIRVAINARRKLRVMWQHRSQLDTRGPMATLPPAARQRLFHNEYFAKTL